MLHASRSPWYRRTRLAVIAPRVAGSGSPHGIYFKGISRGRTVPNYRCR